MMKKEFTISVEEDILLRFNMALQLNNDISEDVCESFMRTYISDSFSKAAAAYGESSVISKHQSSSNPYYGKAINKISKWANKPNNINYKIIRAFLQLSTEAEYVTYEALVQRCSDEENHPDVFVPTFSSNFAQMKLDSEKSYGKVFITEENNILTLWDHIKGEINMYKDNFLSPRSTDKGYVNRNNQLNMGKTDLDGTDHMQKLYMMRCQDCGHEYFANGSDIFLKKCPKCQGGADTGI